MKELPAVKEEKKKGKWDDWELDDMVNTIIRAEEIKNDPEKMKAIGSRMDKKVKAVKSLSDLKKVRDEKLSES